MINLSTKTVMFVDNGLFVSFARKMAPAFKKAYYYTPWQSYAAKTRQVIVGDGFDEMERVKFPLAKADEVDLWVFLDVYHWDLQCFLEDHGARVLGGRRGEEMELYRWEFKQFLKKIGLPVQPCKHLIGIESLRSFLKNNNNKFVKTSLVRGDFETFRHTSYELSEPRLDEIAYHLGAVKDEYEFIVEDEIPEAVEVGYDGFTIDGLFPSHAMMGYEVKDVGMLACVKPYEKLPEPVRHVNSKLTPALKSYTYRGFICTEIRYNRDKLPYLIDPCCRLGSPSNEILQEVFNGWPLALWDGADGTLTSPTVKELYGAIAVIHSEWATENWQPLYYPKEVDQFVKLRFHAKIGGVNYTAPQTVGNPYPGVVVGVGSTLLKAIDHCKDNAAQVKGLGVEVSLASIDKAVEAIREGEKKGIHFSDGALPTVEQLSR